MNQENFAATANNNKQPQLPVDYPGVVVAIAMLTKDTLDPIAKQDIETLVDVTLKNMKRSRHSTNGQYPDNVKRSHLTADQSWGNTDNLLGLSKLASNNLNNNVEDSQSETETDAEGFTSSRQFDNMAFPFF